MHVWWIHLHFLDVWISMVHVDRYAVPGLYGHVFSEIAANYLIERIIHHPCIHGRTCSHRFFPQKPRPSLRRSSRAKLDLHLVTQVTCQCDTMMVLVVGLKFTAWTIFLPRQHTRTHMACALTHSTKISPSLVDHLFMSLCRKMMDTAYVLQIDTSRIVLGCSGRFKIHTWFCFSSFEK